MGEKTFKILVPIDGSNNSDRAVSEAKKYAEFIGGEITLLTVVKPLTVPYFGNQELIKIDNKNLESAKEVVLNEALEEFEDFDGKVSKKLRKGNPADEILEEAEREDYHLIVMGSRGLGAFSKTILGSISDKVLNHTEKNVLIVK